MLPVNVTLFANGIFAGVIKLRRGHEGGPESNVTSALIRRGNVM